MGRFDTWGENLASHAPEVLPNPDGRIEGTGKRIRHIKVRDAAAAGSATVREAVRGQLALRLPNAGVA